jgi:hypothetical protein
MECYCFLLLFGYICQSVFTGQITIFNQFKLFYLYNNNFFFIIDCVLFNDESD